jgi:hypothetical protein
VKFAFVAVSPLVSITYPVMVYVAPACSTPFSETDGPPAPLEFVVLSKLYDPEYAAAVVATGVLAPLNDVQPSAAPSSKLYVTTVCAPALPAHRSAKTTMREPIRAI